MARSVVKLRDGSIGARVSGSAVELEITDTYQVLVDSANEDRYDILYNTTGLPKAGVSIHPVTLLGCTNVTLNVDANLGTRYIANVTYSSQQMSDTNGDVAPQVGNPTQWIPLASVEFEPIERVVQKDLDGKFYLNSVGDPFETGLVLIDRIPVRVFTQYEPVDFLSTAWAATTAYRAGQYVTKGGQKYVCVVFGTSGSTGPVGTTPGATEGDGSVLWRNVGASGAGGTRLDDLENRCDTVNSHAFMGRDAGKLLLEVRRAEIGTYFGFRAWKIEYAMKYNKNGWLHKVADMGYRYKEYDPAASAFVKKPFVSDESGAVFLGKLNGTGGPVADQIDDDPAELSFRVYDTLDFNTFIRMTS